MSLKFGTDGVRGVANEELTPELVLALGRAAARVLGTDQPFVIGRDTRLSGPLLQAALTAGLMSEGADVVDLGVIPTPGVAAIAAFRDVRGAVISASHNPFADNGIKFLDRGGIKLSDEIEARLEADLASLLDDSGSDRPTGAALGHGSADEAGAFAFYEEQLLQSLEGRSLAGLHVVLDCAHGAAYEIAPRVFADAGAKVTVIHADPDGVNINDGAGSTHPELLQKAVVSEGADLGLAFDGDADRVMAVDAEGNIVDGDQILAMCSLDRRERGLLAADTLVVTVMANLGLRLAMERHGVNVVETAVGDRYILEALDANAWTLGGEQSGHIIFRDLATTGDGELTGLQVMDVMARTGRSLADLVRVMTRLPQVLINVRGVNCAALDGADAVWAAVDTESEQLGDSGRILLRKSGTEPIVRVMVEAPTEASAQSVAERVADIVRSELSEG